MDCEKTDLTIGLLIGKARQFCISMSQVRHKSLVGITDGKAVGTYIEHKFKDVLAQACSVEIGSSARGIDLPASEINTDIKTTSINQPQSSCPFRNARQKIFGLGYNVLLFVYRKDDSEEHNLQFLHARFIDSSRTSDYQTTRGLREIMEKDGNIDDIKAFLMDRNLPVDEIALEKIAHDVLENPPLVGYLTISNALQWRLQYSRVVKLHEQVDGVVTIYDS